MTQCMRGAWSPGTLHAPARIYSQVCRLRLSRTRACIGPVRRPRHSFRSQRQRSRPCVAHAASHAATSEFQDDNELPSSLVDVGASRRKGASAISVDQASIDGEGPQPSSSSPDTPGCCNHNHGSAEQPANPVHAVLLWVYKRTGNVLRLPTGPSGYHLYNGLSLCVHMSDIRRGSVHLFLILFVAVQQPIPCRGNSENSL